MGCFWSSNEEEDVLRAVGNAGGGGADYAAMRQQTERRDRSPQTDGRRASSAAVVIPGKRPLHRTSYSGDDEPELLEPSASLQRHTVPVGEVYELIFDGETVTI